ncbi:MAG TPA: hypothetical protein VJX16_04380 [Terriglobales bacterium]|nr:MAG: hypothetical protein AUH13_25480 [Acidobacteria bacterium 13_2_20CM_58_27]HKN32461.1 hypothetical protein [Terriglobales bacterium]
MSRRWGPVADKVHYRGQIDKILGSHALHGSESLCKLLRYLADHALDHPGAAPKEYQIATEVFGRPSDFDPHVDSTVRVQAGRLRGKLAEYYASEGADDQILVDFPRGTYAVAFHERPAGAGRNHGAVHESSWDAAQTPRRWLAAVILLSAALSAAVAVTASRFLNGRTAEARLAGEITDVPTVLRVFWRGFLTGPQEPWVIFSNAAFVGRPDSGMRYYNSARDGQMHTLDHYTGVGEVLAVHALDSVFGKLQQQIRVKRGSLFSLDDAKNNDLIFIGSPSENLTLLEIPSTRGFVFKKITSGPRTGEVEIVNLYPEAGEPKSYLATPSDEKLADDYSVIALVKGLNPARSELILAGTTTIGTQAAVEYVCQPNYLEQLLLRLAVSNSGELKPFEAIIHVKVTRGVPVGSELVALRKEPA